MTARHFEGMRFSKHFILLDFLYDRDVYTFRQPFTIDDIWNGEHEQAALTLCNELLEPCIEAYGPCSIAGGFWPSIVQTPGGHYHTTPHFWDKRHGAAADCVWHDWVNEDKLPIHMVFDLEKRQIAKFDRMISYAGSEFVCMGTKGGDRQRAAVHENRRLGPSRHQYKSYSPRQRYMAYDSGKELVPVHEWRRGVGEGVHSTGKRTRAHHVRTGQYFTLLDFAHNARALADGVGTVPSVSDTASINACRMFSEVLDPLVAEVGRVSIVRGIEPRNYGDDDEHHWASQVDSGGLMDLWFLLPQGTDEDVAMDLLMEHPATQYINAHDHLSGTSCLRVGIRPFEVEKNWSSARSYA